MVRGNQRIHSVLYYVACGSTCSKASSEVKNEQAALVTLVIYLAKQVQPNRVGEETVKGQREAERMNTSV